MSAGTNTATGVLIFKPGRHFELIFHREAGGTFTGR